MRPSCPVLSRTGPLRPRRAGTPGVSRHGPLRFGLLPVTVLAPLLCLTPFPSFTVPRERRRTRRRAPSRSSLPGEVRRVSVLNRGTTRTHRVTSVLNRGATRGHRAGLTTKTGPHPSGTHDSLGVGVPGTTPPKGPRTSHWSPTVNGDTTRGETCPVYRSRRTDDPDPW